MILETVLTLIAVLNPFGNVPLFIGMTEGMSKEHKYKILNIVVATAFLITVIFSLIGDFLMTKFYNIGIDEFKMAGGLILIVIATKNIIFPETEENNPHKVITLEDQIKKAIIPMAFPMLVGPGVLTATLIARAQYGFFITLISIIISFIIIYVVCWLGNYIEKIVGKLVLYILSRVMQIFILAIGFRIFFSGLFDAIKLYIK